MSTPTASVTNQIGYTGDNGCTLGYKQPLIAGTWNLRSGIDNSGNLEMARQTLAARNLDLLCIPEAAKSGSGCERLASGELLIWTGPPAHQPRRNRGVALLCSPRAAKCHICYSVVSSRILTASFSLLGRLTLDLVAFYAPHCGHSANDRQAFRDQLNSVRQNLNRHHFLLEIGDANAHVGSATSESTSYGGALGPHGLGTRNSAGEDFLDDCSAAGLCVANTFFQHKTIHKASYKAIVPRVYRAGEPLAVAPYNNDFVVVRRSFLSSVTDVRVYRGVNGSATFAHSDHHLVVVKLKLRLRAPRAQGPQRNHAILATNESARYQYQEAVRGALVTLSTPNEANGEEKYRQLCDALKTAAAPILPVAPPRLPTQPPPTAWLLHLVAQKRALLMQPRSDARNTALTECRKEIARESKRSKTRELRSVVGELDEAARRGDQRAVYHAVGALKHGHCRRRTSTSNIALKRPDGTLITSVDEQLQHLTAHHTGLLNEGIGTEPGAVDSLPFPPHETTVVHPLTLDHVLAAVSRLKNGKALAPNGVSNEMLKYAPREAHEILLEILSGFQDGALPASCKVTDLISVPKKGAAAFATNRRGIQICDKLYQLKSLLLAIDMNDANDTMILDCQSGFRLGRGCTEQRFALQRLLDECRERSVTLYCTLVDLEKAFDRVDRSVLADIMRSYGYDETYINRALDLHTNTSTRVKWRGQRSAPTDTSWGVQQGSPASNPLWNLFIDVIVRQTLAELGPDAGIRLYFRRDSSDLHGSAEILLGAEEIRLHNLLLADDIVAFANTPTQLTAYLLKLNEVCKRWGMKISTSKTKVIIFHAPDAADALPVSDISIGGVTLDVVTECKYLGSWYSADCSVDREVTMRIGAATGVAKSLQNIWANRHIDLTTKLKIYKSAVLTVLLHGAESWPLTGRDTARLDVFHQRWLRRILHVFWFQHVSNAEILQRARMPSIADRARCLRMLWFGHVIRMGPDRLPYQSLFGQLAGTRRRGRRHTLLRVYRADLLHLQGGVTNGLPWMQCARDRSAWRAFVTRMTSPVTPAAVAAAAAPAGLAGPSPAVVNDMLTPVPAGSVDALTSQSAAGDEPLAPQPIAVAEARSPQSPAAAISSPPSRVSPRIQRRMGLTPLDILLPGVPDRRPYTPPAGPYTGRPRGRPRGSGRGSRRGRR